MIARVTLPACPTCAERLAFDLATATCFCRTYMTKGIICHLVVHVLLIRVWSQSSILKVLSDARNGMHSTHSSCQYVPFTPTCNHAGHLNITSISTMAVAIVHPASSAKPSMRLT